MWCNASEEHLLDEFLISDEFKNYIQLAAYDIIANFLALVQLVAHFERLPRLPVSLSICAYARYNSSVEIGRWNFQHLKMMF